MGIYIYLNFSYNFTKNSHLDFRPTVKWTNIYLNFIFKLTKT